MSLSAPMALLKVVGALTPLMTPEIGAAMTAELQAIFVAMRESAEAIKRIDAREQRIFDMLVSINEKLQGDKPLSTVETNLLLEYQQTNGEDHGR